MESYVIWPGLGLNAAFIAACVVLVLMLTVRKKVSEEKGSAFENAGEFFLDMVTNKYLLIAVSILSLLAGFISTLCLLHHAEVDGFVYGMYIVLALVLPVLLVMFIDDEYGVLCTFAYGVGQSVIGLIFLICCHFPSMWYTLGFLVLDIIGFVLEVIRLERA